MCIVLSGPLAIQVFKRPMDPRRGIGAFRLGVLDRLEEVKAKPSTRPDYRRLSSRVLDVKAKSSTHCHAKRSAEWYTKPANGWKKCKKKHPPTPQQSILVS